MAPATEHSAPLRVALDVGPLHGPRTGIGFAVASLSDTIARRSDVAIDPYVVSFRAALDSHTTRLPLPAALAHRLWARVALPRVDRWLGDAEVVHGTNYVTPPSRLPTVVSVYDCWFLRNPDDANPSVRRAGEVLRAAVRRGALVHTSSHATEQAVRELLHTDRVHTVHLGALPLPPDPGPHHTEARSLGGRPYALAIGTLERRKNLPRLIDAFGRSCADLDVSLVIAGGDGDDRAAVDAAIAALPAELRQRVVLMGRVDEPTRSWLLHHATVLTYPSLDEGFGFPLLDAMQAGVPVVASTAGSIPEVAADAALYAGAHDTDALGSALREAITDDATRQRLTAAGTRRVGTFSWDHCADGVVALYRRAVMEHQR